MKTALNLLFLITLLPLSLIAEEEMGNWNFSGQMQIRTEVDGRDFNHKTPARIYTSMRTRAGIQRLLGKEAGLFVQFQDSRLFGEESNTVTSLANVDIHQAYVFFNLPFNLPISFQAGRFEMNYGTERIFGPLGWHYVGRSFDGAKLSYKGIADIDFFGLTISNDETYIPFPTSDRYQTSVPNSSFSLYGFWLDKSLRNKDKISFFTFFELNDKKDFNGNNLLERINIGLNSNLNFSNLATAIELITQAGKISGKDIFAYLISISANYNIKPLTFGGGIDILSGTHSAETSKFNTFSQDYGTNHKFYGYMDYFINIPLNTNNLGLQNIYFMLGFKPEDSKFSAFLNYHYFMADKISSSGNKNWGQEIDITLNYVILKGINLVWGGSLFLADDLMKEKFRAVLDNGNADPAFWTYFMIQANLN